MTDDELRARIRTYIDTVYDYGDGYEADQAVCEFADWFWGRFQLFAYPDPTPAWWDVANTLAHYEWGVPHIDAHDPNPLTELRYRLARHTHPMPHLGV